MRKTQVEKNARLLRFHSYDVISINVLWLLKCASANAIQHLTVATRAIGLFWNDRSMTHASYNSSRALIRAINRHALAVGIDLLWGLRTARTLISVVAVCS